MALDGLSNGVAVAARHVIGRLLDLLNIRYLQRRKFPAAVAAASERFSRTVGEP
jgi:hypothetical protein